MIETRGTLPGQDFAETQEFLDAIRRRVATVVVGQEVVVRVKSNLEDEERPCCVGREAVPGSVRHTPGSQPDAIEPGLEGSRVKERQRERCLAVLESATENRNVVWAVELAVCSHGEELEDRGNHAGGIQRLAEESARAGDAAGRDQALGRAHDEAGRRLIRRELHDHLRRDRGVASRIDRTSS